MITKAHKDKVLEDIEHLDRKADIIVRTIQTYGYTDERRRQLDVLQQKIRTKRQYLKNKESDTGIPERKFSNIKNVDNYE